MACHLLRGAERGDRGGEERGLGIRGAVELGLGAVEAEPAEVELKGVVRLGEDPDRALVPVGELFAHADRLRALPGKEPRDAGPHEVDESTDTAPLRPAFMMCDR